MTNISHPDGQAQILIIRADASGKIGGGHIMRCLAVADIWAEFYGSVLFVTTEITRELESTISNAGHGLERIRAKRGGKEDAQILQGLGHDISASTIILDGYCFDLEYQQKLRQGTWTLAVYDDDCQRSRFHCDVLINQNIHATAAMYRNKATAGMLLMGPDYAALRKEFAVSAKTSRNYDDGQEILISLGMGNMTSVILEILASIKESVARNATVNIAAAGSDIAQIEKAGNDFDLCLNVRSHFNDMAKYFRGSVFSILSAGGTAHESACLGTPMILVSIADNQIPAYRAFICKNAAVEGGLSKSFDKGLCSQAIDALSKSEQLRRRLGTNAKNTVDGMGASRVAATLGQYRLAQNGE